MRELIFYLVLAVVCFLAVKDAFKGLLCYTCINIVRPELIFWGGDSGSLAFKALFLATLIGFVTKEKRLFQASRYYEVWYILWICLGMLVSLWLSDLPAHYRAYYYVTEILKLFLFGWVIIGLIENLDALERFQTWLLSAFTVLSYWGWDQHFRGNSRLEGLGGSSFTDSNGVAAAFVLVLPLALGKVFHAKSRYGKLLGLVSSLGMTMAIVFTQSRGGFLGLATCLVLYFMHSANKVKFLILIMVSFMLVTPFIDSEYVNRINSISKSDEEMDGSAGSRLVLWQAAMLMFRDKPLFGHGFMTFARAKADYKIELQGKFDEGLLNFAFEPYKVCHGTYFSLLAEGGLFVFIPYMLFIGRFLLKYYRNRSRIFSAQVDTESKHLIQALGIGVMAHCVSILTIDAQMGIFLPIQLICGGILLRFLLNEVPQVHPVLEPDKGVV